MPATIDATLKIISRQAEEKAAREMADRLGLPYAILDDYPFNLEVLSLIPVALVQEKMYAAYVRSSDKVRVAVVRPETETFRGEMQELANVWKRDIEITVVSVNSMHYLITAYLQLIEKHKQEEEQAALALARTEQTNYFNKIKTLEDLAAKAGTVSVTELLDVIVAAAFNQEASDIHLEPGDQVLTVRFRIDGVLKKVLDLPMTQHHNLVSRIKIMASLRLDDQNKNQDGRFSLRDKGIEADVRVSSIPTSYGEGIVMRILRQDMQALALDELGFSNTNRDIIEKIIRKPYGLILVTGPTGSGKSTTLYSMLRLLNTSEKKIITLEDPVEYQMAGLQQSQIDTNKGFTFAEGLRGALRQDPDVVMVGEIRDPETATIALNASLTGHLVLSTLHTNDAISAFKRFLEMGIAPFLLSGSIQMIIAQRLVRHLLPGSTPEQPIYGGRLVVAEVLVPNQDFEKAVIQNKDNHTLEEIAVQGGMVPMLKDGLSKVQAGMTSQEEIYRVTAV